jgi:hypothetical protein
MTHISGFERSQLLLLPEAVDDAFVDELDLAAAGFVRVEAKKPFGGPQAVLAYLARYTIASPSPASHIPRRVHGDREIRSCRRMGA